MKGTNRLHCIQIEQEDDRARPQETILQEKSFELDFLRQCTSTETITDDIDWYFGTPSVVFQLYTGHKSAEWVLQWWQPEYPCMAAARDYLPRFQFQHRRWTWNVLSATEEIWAYDAMLTTR